LIIDYVSILATRRFELPNFDICDAQGPVALHGVSRGYIHSPNFPNYYGNSRRCAMSISVPEDKYLAVYVESLSMESRSRFSSQAKDFLRVDDLLLYGRSGTPALVFNHTGMDQVQFTFSSDWITTALLSSPKGFLIYFECKLIRKLLINEEKRVDIH
jgi:hypothetical protein